MRCGWRGRVTSAKPPAPVGRFHTWWRDERLPGLPTLPGVTIAPADDARLLAAESRSGAPEIEQRLARGHVAWMARRDGEPLGWGWCATTELSIGELGISCALPPGQRYLWDFFTIPRWRGQGIYPRLLQTIAISDPAAERFWVGHDFGNTASARGIAKAGDPRPQSAGRRAH